MKNFIAFEICMLFLFPLAAGYTAPIHDAAAKGDLTLVKALVEESPELVNAGDQSGATSLHHAVAGGHKAVVEFLLVRKADVNAMKEDGVTPLHIAASFGRKEIAELLITNGADVNAEDYIGRTSLALSEERGQTAVAELLRSNGASADMSPDQSGSEAIGPESRWMWAKGNLHTHTTESDGNATPNEVARCYRELGYQFLVISDHGKVVSPKKVQSGGLLIIPGAELVLSAPPVGGIHMNAIGVMKAPKRSYRKPVGAAVQSAIDQISAAGGIAMVNHPDFKSQHLLDVQRSYLLELNWDPSVLEKMWDDLLSSGKKVYGAMTDDAHRYKFKSKDGTDPFGRFVVVRVRRLSVRDILAALRRGDFYTSTGVELDTVEFRGSSLRIGVRPRNGVQYSIQFIGEHGANLIQVNAVEAMYVVPKGKTCVYVRAKISASDGTFGYTQPFWIRN